MKNFIRTLSLLPLLATMALQASAQTSSPFGFEDNTVGGFTGTASTETTTVNSASATVRTGSYSLKMSTTSTGTGNKQWYSNTPYATSANNLYIHYIYWAMAQDPGTSVDASFRYSSSLPLSGSGSSANSSTAFSLTTTGWTRVTNNVTTSSTRYYFPGPRKVTSAGATSIYVDDLIIYTSASSTTDTIKPMAPTSLAGTAIGNLITLNWVSNVDTGIGKSNVAATLILRAPATNTATPVFNDQALYAVAGGSAGPNTVNGWTIISATTGATATTYLDAVTPPGSYIYAVVLRDSAYNYSPVAISAPITAGAPIPTIFANQTGYTGNTGTTIKGTKSTELQYSISGLNLSSNITVTAPTGFEVSLTGGGNNYANSVTVQQTGGVAAATNIFVRYSPTAAIGATGNLNIVHTSTGAAAVNVPVAGTSIETEPGTTGSITFGNVGAFKVEVNLPTIGNGSRRIIVMKSGSDVGFIPTDGVAPTGVSSDFSVAADQGAGDKIVYDGNGSGNTVVTVTGLTRSTTYYFAVYEYNVGTGSSQNYLPNSPITAIARTAENDVSVGHEPGIAGMSVYPNPTNSLLFVQSPVAVNMTIRDITGRIVYAAERSKQADLHQLSTGLYIVQLTDDQGLLLQTTRILKQ